ncbi:class I SAM-dependent methyltransferase [Nocardioides pacificus]
MPELELNRRQRRLWDLHDLSTGRGLEIGPLHHALVPRAHADVRYLDVFDRAGLIESYASDPNVDPALIPEIDFALYDGERVRSLPEAVGAGGPFDWVVASHVIEHVPDVVGWLAQIAEVTVDDGRLLLMVPDRRYCFDVHRPGTTVGQMLQAHELGDVVPSVRAVYDYKRGHAVTRAGAAWKGRPPGYENRIYSLEQVLEQVARARSGEYVDSHVWTFTPGTLAEQLVELRRLGLSDWTIEELRPTLRNELEFSVVLQRLPRDPSARPAPSPDEPGADVRMPDWVEESAKLRADLVESRSRLRRRRERITQLQAELAASRASNQGLRRELESTRRSWRWRIGGAATRPIGIVRRRLRSR